MVWTVNRPYDDRTARVTLFAFDPAGGATLFSGDAGTWPNANSNANIVPTVGNGRVFVASYRQLAIFGLTGPQASLADIPPAPAYGTLLQAGEQSVAGMVARITGTHLVLIAAGGRRVPVDFTQAQALFRVAAPAVGRSSRVVGHFDQSGQLVARVVLHGRAQDASQNNMALGGITGP